MRKWSEDHATWWYLLLRSKNCWIDTSKEFCCVWVWHCTFLWQHRKVLRPTTYSHISYYEQYLNWNQSTVLDLVPRVLSRKLGDELSPPGTIVGRILSVIPVNTQYVQIFFQCVLSCPLWSSSPPPAIFWSPFYGQTSWSGCWESQDVSNKSSSSGCYCVI